MYVTDATQSRAVINAKTPDSAIVHQLNLRRDEIYVPLRKQKRKSILEFIPRKKVNLLKDTFVGIFFMMVVIQVYSYFASFALQLDGHVAIVLK